VAVAPTPASPVLREVEEHIRPAEITGTPSTEALMAAAEPNANDAGDTNVHTDEQAFGQESGTMDGCLLNTSLLYGFSRPTSEKSRAAPPAEAGSPPQPSLLSHRP